MKPDVDPSVLLRREVLVSVLLVGLAGTALGGVTWSYYADSDPADANTVQGQTMDLRVDGSDSVSGAFTIAAGIPGDSASHTFDLTNDGAAAADHVEVSFAFAENDPRSEPSDADLNAELNAAEAASLVRVTTLEYVRADGTVQYDATADMTDDNGNGVLDLQDVRGQDAAFDDLEAPGANGGSTTSLKITVQLVDGDTGAFSEGANTAGSLTGADEDIMADGVDVTVTFTLNQDSSQ